MSSRFPEPGVLRFARRAGAALLVVLQAGILALLVAAALRGETGQRPTAPGALPAGAPAVIGLVARLGDDAFVASAYAGEHEVRVDPQTVVIRRDGPASFRDLRPGCGVIVWGADMSGGAIHARTILVGPAP